MSEAKVNAELQRNFERFERREVPRYVNGAIATMQATRLDVNDLLTEYAKNDGTISKARINALLRSLESVESEARRAGEQALTQAVNDAADYGMYSANAALLVGLGAALLAGYTTTSVAELTAQAGASFAEVIAEGALLSIEGINVSTMRRYVRSSVFESVGSDNKTLTDRIWQTSGDLRSELQKSIRNMALQNRPVDAIMREVKRVYEAEEWKVRRLVQTEVLTAYRTATAESAKRSDAVKALKIVDHPDGHRHHERHECYAYARANQYGMGRGVYPVTETKILQPHPQCTSSLHFVLADELNNEGGTDNVNR